MNEQEQEFLCVAFLDWFNDYLTIERFAEHYQISEKQADILIELGREVHENYVTGKEWVNFCNNYFE